MPGPDSPNGQRWHGDPAMAAVDFDRRLHDDLEALYTELRHDIGAATQAVQDVLAERLDAIEEQIAALRAELMAARVESGRVVGAQPDDDRDHASWPAQSFSPQSGDAAGMPTGRAGPVGMEAPVPHVGMARPGAQISGHAEPPAQPDAGRTGGRAAVPPVDVRGASRGSIPRGVLQHTETVQVTTRHTILDPHADGPSGTMYGGGADYDGMPHGDRGSERGEDDWPGPPQNGHEPAWGRNVEPETFSDQRAGDRWAAARSDERGSELRMGERRATLRTDETGTELRLEDRWAAMRRQEARPEDFRPDGYRQTDGRWDDGGRWAGHAPGPSGREYGSGERAAPDPERWAEPVGRDGYSGRDDSADWSDGRGAGRTDYQVDGSWSESGPRALPSAAQPPSLPWEEQPRQQGWHEPEREPLRPRPYAEESGYPPPEWSGARELPPAPEHWR